MTITPTYTVSLASLARAFQKWEEGYRVSPDRFISKEECRALSVDDISARRAEYFLALLEEGK